SEQLDQVVVAAPSEERAEVALLRVPLEDGRRVVRNAPYDRGVEDRPVRDPGPVEQGEQLADPIDPLDRRGVEAVPREFGQERLQARERHPRADALEERAQPLDPVGRDTGGGELRVELGGRDLPVLVHRAEERAGLAGPRASAEAVGDRAVAHSKRVEALGADLVEQEGGRRQDVRLGLDPGYPEDVEVELDELPRPAGLGLLVAPRLRDGEPFHRERLRLRAGGKDAGQRGGRLGGQGDRAVTLVVEHPSLGGDPLAALRLVELEALDARRFELAVPPSTGRGAHPTADLGTRARLRRRIVPEPSQRFGRHNPSTPGRLIIYADGSSERTAGARTPTPPSAEASGVSWSANARSRRYAVSTPTKLRCRSSVATSRRSVTAGAMSAPALRASLIRSRIRRRSSKNRGSSTVHSATAARASSFSASERWPFERNFRPSSSGP